MAENPDKLVIVNRSHAGQKMALPGAGTLQLNDKGEVEVSTEVADQLLQLGNGWSAQGDLDNAQADFKSKLEAMSLEEMIALAVESQIPEEEYKKFRINALLMKRFLLKKLGDTATK